MATSKPIAEAKSAAPSLEIVRHYAAPPELLFKVWTDPAHIRQWWAPRDGERDFSNAHSELDLRVGGAYRVCIRSPDGEDSWMGGKYLTIDPPQHLAFTFAWEQSNGVPNLDTLIEVRFDADGNGTRMTFTQAPFASEESRDSHRGGWGDCFERLAEYLDKLQEEGDAAE